MQPAARDGSAEGVSELDRIAPCEDEDDDEAAALAELVTEGLQKLGRAQARQGARLEDLERKLEAGLADLRGMLTKLSGRRDAPDTRWDEILDAADALDEAARLARDGGQDALARGMDAVRERIDRFLERADVRRVMPLGQVPDPAMVRVVGVVDGAGAAVASSPADDSPTAEADLGPDGDEPRVERVVRAAVLEQGRLIREGEVLVARRAELDVLNRGGP